MLLSEASLPFELQSYVAGQSDGPMSPRELVAIVIWVPAMVITLIAGRIGVEVIFGMWNLRIVKITPTPFILV
jgi:hypothetical protein